MKKYFKVAIPKPCNENWNEMTLKEKGRFCSSCAKTVIDFTKMNVSEIQNYLSNNQNKKVCGHIKQSQLDTINLKIPIQSFQKRLSFKNTFLLSLLIVMGSSIMSCTNHNGKSQKIETVEVVDTLKTKTIDTINEEHKNNLSETSIITEELTIEGEIGISQPPPIELEGLIVMGDIAPIDYENNEPIPFAIVEQLPKFSNTPKELTKTEEIKYFRERINGFVKNKINIDTLSSFGLKGKHRVNVLFEINNEGIIDSVKVRAPHPEIEKIAKDIINLLPQFKPAKQNNKEVTVRYALPIIFTLDD